MRAYSPHGVPLPRVFFLVLSTLSLAAATGARHGGALSRSMTTAELITATRSSRPLHADPAFDCGWRVLALNYSAFIQPWLSRPQLQAIADALQIASLGCDAAAAARLIAAHAPAPRDAPSARALPAAAATTLYVDYVRGSDANDGSLGAPLKTVAAAVARARGGGDPAHTSVVLRNGTHFLANTIALGAADSGLTFSAFPGEAPVISGALPLPSLAWARVNHSSVLRAPGPVLPNTNNVFGHCGNAGVPNKGVMADWQACQASCLRDTACTSWTFNNGSSFGTFSNVCCWRIDGVWAPRAEAETFSQNVSSPPAPPPRPSPSPSPAPAMWAAPLPAAALPPRLAAGALPALHLAGRRATLARFPNANPELDLFPVGYIAAATWLRPLPGPVWDATVNEALPAGVSRRAPPQTT